jgi:hypothetical protein
MLLASVQLGSTSPVYIDKTHNQTLDMDDSSHQTLDMDDSSQDSPSDHRQSSEPGTSKHHRCYEVNTNTKYGRYYELTTIT